MANAILNFHFDFLTPSLTCPLFLQPCFRVLNSGLLPNLQLLHHLHFFPFLFLSTWPTLLYSTYSLFWKSGSSFKWHTPYFSFFCMKLTLSSLAVLHWIIPAQMDWVFSGQGRLPQAATDISRLVFRLRFRTRKKCWQIAGTYAVRSQYWSVLVK